jgi:hypothetical protein
MGALNSKSSSNEITIDFRDDGSVDSSAVERSKFTVPKLQKKHSKTRLQLLKERARTSLKKDSERQQDPSLSHSGILQRLRTTFGNILPRFRNRQYHKAQEEDSQHGVAV